MKNSIPLFHIEKQQNQSQPFGLLEKNLVQGGPVEMCVIQTSFARNIFVEHYKFKIVVVKMPSIPIRVINRRLCYRALFPYCNLVIGLFHMLCKSIISWWDEACADINLRELVKCLTRLNHFMNRTCFGQCRQYWPLDISMINNFYLQHQQISLLLPWLVFCQQFPISVVRNYLLSINKICKRWHFLHVLDARRYV